VKLSKTFTETMSWEAYGDKALFRTSIYEWFRNSRESLEDDESSGRL